MMKLLYSKYFLMLQIMLFAISCSENNVFVRISDENRCETKTDTTLNDKVFSSNIHVEVEA